MHKEVGEAPRYQNAKKYYVTAKQATILDALLRQHIDPGQVLTAIEAGGVWLGKKRLLDSRYPVQKGETLTVYVSPFQGRHYKLSSEQILFEDCQVLVLGKPAGLTTVSDRSNLYYNLSSAARSYLAGNQEPYPCVAISRLDFMVSGAVLFAKNKDAERALFAEMMGRRIAKWYVANIVSNAVEAPCFRVKNTIDFRQGKRGSEQGKLAETKFVFRQRLSPSLLQYNVFPMTGRRHQIRIHAAQSLGPIYGDRLYGDRSCPDHQPIQLFCVGYNFTLFSKRYRIRCLEILK